MKLRYLLTSFALLAGFQAWSVRVLFDYRVFEAPGQGPYVEFITSFDARTVELMPLDSGYYQSKVEMSIIVSKDNNIFDFRKVMVQGPRVTPSEAADFLSLERFMLPAGVYSLELEIIDLGRPEETPTVHIQKVEINNPSSGAFVSDIEFVAAYRPVVEATAFSKSGYDMLPYASNYFPTSLNSIIFYAEMYGTDKLYGEGAAFVSNVCVVDAKDNTIENCKRIKREKAAPVVPMLQTLDIRDLPTGEYKIRLEIRDRDNMLVYLKERNFTRNKVDEIAIEDQPVEVKDEVVQASFAGHFTDRNALYEHIQYHLPIANANDKSTIDNVLVTSDLKALQGFLYVFWTKRAPNNPDSAWAAYNTNIEVVKKNFATRIKPGWLTDRGRVYLQYGKPNTRIMRPSDSDYWPFEIWHYYVTDGNLHNRRFLFYDTTLSGDMELLHSDVPGEVKNFYWKDMVRSRPGSLGASDASATNAAQRSDPNSRDEVEDLWYNPH